MIHRPARAAALLALMLAPLLALAPVLAGCATTTGGTARKPSATAASPAAKQALLDGPALSSMLNQPFEAAPHFSHSGGNELLGDRMGTPADCVGVVFMLQRRAYQSAGATTIASQGWAHSGHSVKVDMVAEGAVSLPTAAGAAALFAKLSAQWKQCDGTTLAVPADIWPQNSITGVRVTDSVAAATISRRPDEHSILNPLPAARALGVRGNCLVEVDVSFVPVSSPADQGSGDINTSAVDIAHAIMDRLGAPS